MIPLVFFAWILYDFRGFLEQKQFFLNKKYTPQKIEWNRKETIFDRREWTIDTRAMVLNDYPFVMETATILKKPVAFIEVKTNGLGPCEAPQCKNISDSSMISHQFRAARFHEFFTGGVPTENLKNILGVTAPIIRLVPNAVAAHDQKESLDILRSTSDPNFFNSNVIVEGGAPSAQGNADPPGQFEVVKYRGNFLHLKVDMKTPGYLVYADNWAPEWRAKVDGHNEPLLIANHSLKAIALKPGQHDVVLSYFPSTYMLAALLPMLLIVGVTGVTLIHLKSVWKVLWNEERA